MLGDHQLQILMKETEAACFRKDIDDDDDDSTLNANKIIYVWRVITSLYEGMEGRGKRNIR
jgi:hypothetical protein